MAAHCESGVGNIWLLRGLFLGGLALGVSVPALQPAGARAPAPTETKGWSCRSAEEREKLLKKFSGTKESEAAVALGLEWLALHQSSDGNWSPNDFNKHAHEKAGTAEKEFKCDCAGVGQENDIAATAFGLLPFLGAGYTHKLSNDKDKVDHAATVKAGIDFLVSKQKNDGDLGAGTYAQGLATIALCEAYGMTEDPKLKDPAQKAIDYIVSAQHEAGGWRYKPKEAGDTSVTGWQLQALKASQLAGLKIPKATLISARKFLDSVHAENIDAFGFGYTGPGNAPTTTAVGLLSRMDLGWNPKNPRVLAGANTLASKPPGSIDSVYYYYYATQVMRQLGGEHWEAWNLKMRDMLIEKQDKGDDAKHKHQKGSWSPVGDAHGAQGGRIMQTSLSLLTLEVYYRYPRKPVKDDDK